MINDTISRALSNRILEVLRIPNSRQARNGWIDNAFWRLPTASRILSLEVPRCLAGCPTGQFPRWQHREDKKQRPGRFCQFYSGDGNEEKVAPVMPYPRSYVSVDWRDLHNSRRVILAFQKLRRPRSSNSHPGKLAPRPVHIQHRVLIEFAVKANSAILFACFKMTAFASPELVTTETFRPSGFSNAT